MREITIGIDGMMCEMCEAHINDAIRAAVPVKKVKASHKKCQAVIISDGELDEDKLRTAVEKTGYKVLSITSQEYEKKGVFSRLK